MDKNYVGNNGMLSLSRSNRERLPKTQRVSVSAKRTQQKVHSTRCWQIFKDLFYNFCLTYSFHVQNHTYWKRNDYIIPNRTHQYIVLQKENVTGSNQKNESVQCESKSKTMGSHHDTNLVYILLQSLHTHDSRNRKFARDVHFSQKTKFFILWFFTFGKALFNRDSWVVQPTNRGPRRDRRRM